MPLRDSFSETMPMEAMLQAVRRSAQGEPCLLNVFGFTVRVHPERIALPAAAANATTARLKVFSTFLLRLSKTHSAAAQGTSFLVAFERTDGELFLGVGNGSDDMAWMPCEIVSYSARQTYDAPTLVFGQDEPGSDGTGLRRIVL